MVTPFLKWAGGKAQLLPQFERLFPAQFENYVEPFVGSVAVFFHLYSTGRLRGHVCLNDRNPDLILCYQAVRDHVEELIGELERHARGRHSASYFYEVRSWDREVDFAQRWTPVQRAARIMFLNRTCYNGLYRVNSQGHFNVPFGRYANPTVCNPDNLRRASASLQGVDLRSEPFEQCAGRAQAGDFVYFDPPYHPLSQTASFTGYTQDNFTFDDQRHLAAVFRTLDARGCKLMLSNSWTEPILELYRGFHCEKVLARRAINSKADRRGEVAEVVVLNYQEN